MSLEKGLEWEYEQHQFKGYSIAGQTTSLFYKNAKVAFDIAQGLPYHLSAKLFCLSHLHADHGSGIAYVLSQRSLFRQPTANIMLPEYAVDSIHRILKEWQNIEGFEYDYELTGVNESTTFKLSDKLTVKSFPTVHRVPSFGYMLYEKKKKLKKVYENASREEILKAKSQGQAVEELYEAPLLAFTGDTQIEFLDQHPDIKKVPLLFMETTYLDEKKSIEETRKWGHTHLDELLPRLYELKNAHISLIHLSARYSTPQAFNILKEKLPENWQDRISVFPRPF
jgi:ribonuclease Z